VKKKDGTTRVCLDLRPLNKLVRPQPFHLPNIRDTIASLQGAKWFTKLDQLSAFTQLPIDPESSEKMSFTTPLGRFRPVRLPFGLATAPAYQQLFLAETLSEELGVSAYVYLDDILVFSSDDLDDHLRAVERTFKKLAAVGASLKLSKCEFAKPGVEWLGFALDERGCRVSRDRIRDIVDTPTPSSTKEVRQFMGKIAFIQHFIPRCAPIAAPLYKLTPVNKIFRWGDEEQMAFDSLRNQVESSGILWFPRVGKPYTIYADGSGIGCGGWLTQMINGRPRALAACSRRFEPREMRSHSTTEREAAAIRFCLEAFRYFIAGEPGLTVVTDHKPLLGALDPQKEPSTSRLKRMAMAISEYSPKIVWEAGRLNVAADALSRQPLGDAPPPDEVLAYAADRVPRVVITAESQRADPELARLMGVFRAIKARGRRGLPAKDSLRRAHDRIARRFTMFDGVLFHIEYPRDDESDGDPAIVPYVPTQQRASVFSYVHDDPVNGGHQGRDKTVERMRRHFYWPKMHEYVAEQIATCETCQLAKASRQVKYGTLKPIPPMAAFEQISMDVMDATERGASGARWILVIQDSATALLSAAPLVDMSGDTAAAALKQAWLKCYPIPLRVITDNGTNLAQGRMKELLASHDIELATTEPGRAQGNGRAERAVQTLKSLLTTGGMTDSRPWDERLDDAVRAYNAARQASTGYAPAHLAFGSVPQLRGAASEGARRMLLRTGPQTLEDLMAQRGAAREAAADNMAKAQARQKAYFDRRRRDVRFPAGSLVRMLRTSVQLTKKRKFDSPWVGPLVVVEEKHPGAYRLRFKNSGKMVRRTINVERLAPFLERKGLPSAKPPTMQEAVRGNRGPSAAGQPQAPRWGSFEAIDEDDVAQDARVTDQQQCVEQTSGDDSGETNSETTRTEFSDAQSDAQETEEASTNDQLESPTPDVQPSTPESTDGPTEVQSEPEAAIDSQPEPAATDAQPDTSEAQPDSPEAPGAQLAGQAPPKTTPASTAQPRHSYNLRERPTRRSTKGSFIALVRTKTRNLVRRVGMM